MCIYTCNFLSFGPILRSVVFWIYWQRSRAYITFYTFPHETNGNLFSFLPLPFNPKGNRNNARGPPRRRRGCEGNWWSCAVTARQWSCTSWPLLGFGGSNSRGPRVSTSLRAITCTSIFTLFTTNFKHSWKKVKDQYRLRTKKKVK